MILRTLLLAVLLAPATASDPTLVERIAEREVRVAVLHESCSFTTTRRDESLDATGKVLSWTETEERHDHRDGVISRKVVRHVVDGKDRTSAKAREKPQELESVEPFSAAASGDYRFETLPADPETGWARIAFKPKRKGVKHAAHGTVAVDPVTGAIRTMSYEPDDPGTLVQKMKVSMEYETPSPEGPTLSRVRVVAAGGFLFVKKRMRVTVEFSNYVYPDHESRKDDGTPPVHP